MGFLDKVTVDDINVKGKKVLVRCDFNVRQQNYSCFANNSEAGK